MNCLYCKSLEHDEELEACPKRKEDAQRFVKESRYINSRRVNIKKEKCTIYCGRPRAGQSWEFGNPFEIGPDGDREKVISRYRYWLETGESFGNKNATEENRQWILQNLHNLKGEILGCFCGPRQACHCDVLIEMAYN